MSDVLTTREVRQRLTNRFGRTSDAVMVPEHLVLFEVTIDGRPRTAATPAGQVVYGRPVRQRIDAVAVGIWRRTEHLVHGFEIKVSRADLLAELRDPSKAEAGARMCDRWWLALGDRTILKDTDVLPAGWGVLAPHGRGLTILREPDPMPGERDGGFMAGLMVAGLRLPTYRRSLGYQAGLAKGMAHAERADRMFDKGYIAGRAAERADHEYRAAQTAS